MRGLRSVGEIRGEGRKAEISKKILKIAAGDRGRFQANCGAI